MIVNKNFGDKDTGGPVEYPPYVTAWIFRATEEPFVYYFCRIPPVQHGLDFQGNVRFFTMYAFRIPPEFTASITRATWLFGCAFRKDGLGD